MHVDDNNGNEEEQLANVLKMHVDDNNGNEEEQLANDLDLGEELDENIFGGKYPVRYNFGLTRITVLSLRNI
jgi:hypothetical protein